MVFLLRVLLNAEIRLHQFNDATALFFEIIMLNFNNSNMRSWYHFYYLFIISERSPRKTPKGYNTGIYRYRNLVSKGGIEKYWYLKKVSIPNTTILNAIQLMIVSFNWFIQLVWVFFNWCKIIQLAMALLY